MNNKGMALPILFGVVGIVALIGILFASGVFANIFVGSATNIGNEEEGCVEQTYWYEVTGELVVEDGSWIGVEPQIREIDQVGFRTLAWLEPFDWEVELFDSQTGELLSSDRGSAELSSSVDSTTVNFILPFSVDDCDGLIDVQLELDATLLETDDFSPDISTMSETINIRGSVKQ